MLVLKRSQKPDNGKNTNDKIIYSCKIILIYSNIYGFVGKYEQELPQTLRKTIQFCCFQIDLNAYYKWH